MSFRLALISGLLCLLTGSFADVPVFFDNRVFGTARLVTISVPFGVNQGPLPLRNGIPEFHSEWIAQLFRVINTNGSLIRVPIGDAANFRAPTTGLPGTWSGGTRIIPGVAPGEVVQLQIRVWDKRYASFDVPRSCGYPTGESPIFDYVYAPSAPEQPSDKEMKNFEGFVVTQPLSPCYLVNPSPPPLHLIPCNENEEATVVPPSNFTYGSWFMWVVEGSLANRQTGSALGELANKGENMVYRPDPFTYGVEDVWGTFCCGNSAVYARFEIAPSHRRPYLDVVAESSNTAHSLVLRGLAPKRYRVDQSDDLVAWTPVGEFTANYSEVPVHDLALADAKSRFYRAVELLP